MPHSFDATLKDLFGQAPRDLCAPFGLPAIEPVQALNVDLSTISAATDIAIGFGEPMREIADLNFQSGPDAKVASRLLLYNAAFHLKFAVPVRSILVLLRPKAQTPGLTGNLSYFCGGQRVIFGYDVIRLWKQPVELFLKGGLALLPLAPLCKMPAGKPLRAALREVVREIDRRLVGDPHHAQAVRLMTAAFILTGLRVPKETLSDIYSGARIMHQSTAYDSAVDEGSIKTSHRALLSLGRQLFGDPNPKTEAALTAIDDPERLQRMIDIILRVKSWKALLAAK
jgi:hypothetical protein